MPCRRMRLLAAEPGLPDLDLFRAFVLRARPRPAAAQRVRLRFRGLSTGVQPQPDLRRRGIGCSRSSTPWWTGPDPASTCPSCAPSSAPRSSPHPTTFPGYRGRDQDTYRRDLTVFKLHFGRLIGKAYTTGERVLRFEAIAHNTAELRCGRMIEKFPEIVTRLAGVVERFGTALDCVDTGFLADGVLDQLPPRPGSAPPASAVSTSTNPGCERAARRPGAGAGTERIHRRRLRREGPRENRHIRVHHPASGVRPAQTSRQIARRQARADAPLPGCGAGRAHRRCAAHPPRPGQCVHPRRHPQPTDRSKTKGLDQHRLRLRTDPRRHADPLRRPGPHDPGAASRLTIPTTWGLTSTKNCRSAILKRLAELDPLEPEL